MKKQIIVLNNIHSFIDVITNSSTELFIIDNYKDNSIEAIKEMLNLMLNCWNVMAIKGLFGEYYIKNKRFNLDKNKESKVKPIYEYEDVFGDVFVFTNEIYKEHKKSGWSYASKDNIGKIIIEGASDNSIPEEIMNWIETAFGYKTERFHLG